MHSFKNYITEKVGSFTAWHGSSARFDKFEKVKAHTGSGGAAYGSGIYISKNIDVGKYYQKLSKSNTSTLYKLKVSIDTDKLLRWDLPFDRQPKFIQKVLKTIDYDDSRGTEGRYYYQALRSSYGTGKSGPAESKKASDYLESKGVQGTFFNKDKKIPGQNFVIFDPKRLTIIQRFDKRGKELK